MIETIKNLIRNVVQKFKEIERSTIVRVITLAAAAGVFLAAIFLLWVSSWRIPTLDSFADRNVTQSTKIYDRTGQILLYDVYHNIKRTVVPFDTISPNVKNAILAIEDVDFYSHGGIKITSIIRAILANITGLGYAQGGSTITQQVVKNSLLTNEKQISRKLKEWVLAPKIEKILTKDEIFSIYLNEIPFGGSIYGIEEASQEFFGKSSKDVTLAEAAYLASLPKAPSFYSPYGPNKKALDDRKNLVLSEMLRNGFIKKPEYDKAVAEKVTFRPQEDFGIKAPHFVMYVRDQLVAKYGERVLEEGGLRVITTLDYNLEKFAEDAALTQALQNKKNFNAENIGLVAIAPKTGDILAMVGSRNYFDKEINGNFNITTAHRQPGSAFKPFAYAEAFLKGYTPDTVLFDVPTEFSTTCNPDGSARSPGADCYMPVNYDGKYRGPTSLRNALAQSINIPSIKTLYLAGMKDTLQLAKDMGIQSLGDANQYGLTLVLGGGEVSMLDLTSAYGVFANEGVRNPYRAILEVKDQNGNVLEKADGVQDQTTETSSQSASTGQSSDQQTQANPPVPQIQTQPVQGAVVLDQNVAREVTDVLSDEAARAPAFGFNSPLFFSGRDVAVKTGTTNDYKDATIVGYTPDIAIGAWAGNNNNTSMEKKIAAFIIAPYWHKVMAEALKTVPDTKFIKPQSEISNFALKPVLRGKWQGGESTLIDKVSGKRATEFTPPDSLDEVLSGGVHSILYWLNKADPRSTATPTRDDPQYASWEYGVRAWVTAHGISDGPTGIIPNQYDDVHNQSNLPTLNIMNPLSGQTYSKNTPVNVEFNTTGHYPFTKVDYFVNDEYVGSAISPFRFSFIPADVSSIHISGTSNQSSGQNSGQNTLRIAAVDSVFNHVEKSVQFNVSN